MSKEMVISSNPHETRVAIMEEGQLCEYYVERQKEFALVGSIYKGRVTRVLPGMQSAFVEIGLDSDAFLYVSDFLEESEELDHIVTTVVDKVEKMEEQGGHVFAENHAAPALEPADVESGPMAHGEGSYGDGPHAEFAHEEGEHAHDAGHAEGAEPHAGHGAPQESAAGHVIEPMEGESITRGAGSAQGASPQGQSHGQGRPSFGDRDRGGRGRDRFNRGGRGGGRGGRGGGGRFNRGGRGGDRPPRFGRELPSSKYASPHAPYERSGQPGQTGEPGQQLDQTTDSGPAEGYTPIVLPGESLAKYRDKPLAPPAPAASAGVTEELKTVVPDELSDVAATPHEVSEAPRAEFRSSSIHAVEPLPGESLSKWKREAAEESGDPQSSSGVSFSQPASPEKALHSYENAISEHEVHTASPETEEAEEDSQAHFLHAAEQADEETSADELSADEAAIIAEHVAEAQIEEEAREAQRHDFASADEAAEAAEVALTGAAPARESELEEEVEDAVADALDETEEPLESESDAEEEGDAEAERAHESASEHAAVEEEVSEFPDVLAAAEAAEGHLEPLEGEHISGAPAPEGSEAQRPFNARVRGDFRARMQHPRRGGRPDRGRDRGGRRDNRGDRDRGGRPHHGGGHHGHSHGGHRPQQRRPQLIADMLKQGQEIIVQIAKEPLGKKGARITSHVALPGRYLVYMPTLDHNGISRKIVSAEERSRLRHLVNEAKGSSGGGFIVRTAAASAPPEDVRADVEFLTKTWAEIKSRSEQRKAPALLHRDLNLVERILRDYITPDFGAIWVDSEEEFTKVVDFMSRFQPAMVGRVKLYGKDTPIFEEFGIQQEIDKGLRPKVWLKSGGYIVINHTEALVAIDVNTGKFVGKGSNRLEDTIVRTNLEAVKEIVRQMRLRDLGGIIIIDFIDMEERRNREKVMAALEDALRADRAPSKMLRFNEFGLIAITRKRTKQALERTLCQPCPYCTGSGMVKSIPTLCYEIQTEARKMAPEIVSGSITLRVHPEIAKALKTREASLVDELEHWTKKSIIIQADPTLHWEQYDIY
ncbi:MAG TPA: Rne/Rng family ribonuclease [Candidatus Acidoferrales bacterium]|jgi:ribonuclease G|nr:Rne/Rng family ribonuclease [Candidatus Acidoferrales bacterium]